MFSTVKGQKACTLYKNRLIEDDGTFFLFCLTCQDLVFVRSKSKRVEHGGGKNSLSTMNNS